MPGERQTHMHWKESLKRWEHIACVNPVRRYSCGPTSSMAPIAARCFKTRAEQLVSRYRMVSHKKSKIKEAKLTKHGRIRTARFSEVNRGLRRVIIGQILKHTTIASDLNSSIRGALFNTKIRLNFKKKKKK